MKLQKFNNLTAIKYTDTNKKYRKIWLFKCDCGKEKKLPMTSVKCGAIKSCGCLRIKHGMYKTKIYTTWAQMKSRCDNTKSPHFKRYGGRGIKVCKHWMKFENFYKDMFPTWKEGLSIDRINNDGNYSKKNCRWATAKIQSNNTSYT